MLWKKKVLLSSTLRYVGSNSHKHFSFCWDDESLHAGLFGDTVCPVDALVKALCKHEKTVNILPSV